MLAMLCAESTIELVSFFHARNLIGLFVIFVYLESIISTILSATTSSIIKYYACPLPSFLSDTERIFFCRPLLQTFRSLTSFTLFRASPSAYRMDTSHYNRIGASLFRNGT